MFQCRCFDRISKSFDLLLEWDELSSGDGIFMQNKARCRHSARNTKSYLQSHNITVMKWPPYSPDLNPIENLWGIISNKIYDNERQFKSTEELKDAVIQEWRKTPIDLLQKLAMSIAK